MLFSPSFQIFCIFFPLEFYASLLLNTDEQRTFSLSILCENEQVPSICWHFPRRNLYEKEDTACRESCGHKFWSAPSNETIYFLLIFFQISTHLVTKYISPCTHRNFCWIMNIRTFSLCVLCTFSCNTTSITHELRNTLQSACSFYGKIKYVPNLL